ncbi:Uncharacterised protein [uncultured archaeon]|nr:Uncharacterised protein [uncultured archaeon]
MWYSGAMDKSRCHKTEKPDPSYAAHLRLLRKHWEGKLEYAKQHDYEGVDLPQGVIQGLSIAITLLEQG